MKKNFASLAYLQIYRRLNIITRCASGCDGRVPDLQSGGCGFKSQPGLLRTKVYSAFHPSGVGK